MRKIYRRYYSNHIYLSRFKCSLINNQVVNVKNNNKYNTNSRLFSSIKNTGRGLPAPQYDYNSLIQNVDYVMENIKNRKCPGNPELIVKTHHEYKEKMDELDELRQRRNKLSKKNKNNSDKQNIDLIRSEGKQIKNDIKEVTEVTEKLFETLQDEMGKIPNDTHPLSPIGNESNAVEIKKFGTKPDTSNGKFLDHVEICNKYDLLDFDAGVRVAGSKFLFFKNDAVLLELALVNWAMNELSSTSSSTLSKLNILKSFVPVITPDVALTDIVQRCGFLPREQEDGEEDTPTHIYNIKNTELSLIGTSEIPLAGSKAGLKLDPETLPLKYVGFSHCFRAEAGASGLLNKGLYRMHQFSKVEMFGFCNKYNSDEILDEIVDIQVELISKLGLHGRVLDMPTEELGAAAYRKFDVEVYMPGREEYGEVCSASNCTDYQSRRLGIRSGKDGFLHTVNGTAIAVPRIILSILETHQTDDGEVIIPEVLRPYFGRDKISLTT